MLEQEIYDITRDHLLKQIRSFTGHGSGCAYNGHTKEEVLALFDKAIANA